MTNMMPQFSKMLFRPGSNPLLHYAWPITLKQGCVFECPIMPTDAWTNTQNCVIHGAGPQAGWSMVLNFSSGYCTFRGIGWDPGAVNTAGVIIDTDHVQLYTQNGLTALQTQQVNSAPATLGSKFFKSLAPNIQIALSTAGVAGGTLRTTLTAVADEQHATLGLAASSTSNFCQATFSPAGYALPPTPQNRISTQCLFEYLQLLCIYGQIGRRNETIGLRISASAQGNCEYNVHRHIQCFGTDLTTFAIPQIGNSNGRGVFNCPGPTAPGWATQLGFSAPTAGNMMTAGSNAIGNFTADTFSPSMNGARWRGPGGTADLGARGYSGTSDPTHTKPLDGYFKYLGPRSGALYQDVALTIPLNAVVNAGVTPYFMLGETVGVGLQVGPSQNAKRQTTYECHFQTLAIGVDCQGGSIHQLFPNYPGNEVNVAMGVAQSEPSSEIGPNSEGSRCHLFLGSPQPYTIEKGRFAMGLCTPGEGFIKFVAGYGSALFRMVDTQIENVVPPSCTIFGYSLTAALANGGTGQAAQQIVEGCRFPDVDTMSAFGWDDHALSNGVIVFQRFNQCSNVPNLLPLESWITTTQSGIFNGVPKRYTRGTTFFSNQRQPVLGDFRDAPSWAMYSTGDGSGQGIVERPYIQFLKSDGVTMASFAPVISGMVTLVDGANVAVNGLAGDYFVLAAGGNRTIVAPASPNFVHGHSYTFRVYNATGGAIVTTWNFAFHLAGAWVDAAAGKARFITFRCEFGVFYETSRGVADVA
jgi:hypothetical protein